MTDAKTCVIIPFGLFKKGGFMAKDLTVCDLLDIYGPLLTEKKRKLLEFYYCDDLSLSEIVENEGGSRQGVQNMIKRSVNELTQMENTLLLLELSKKRSELYSLLKHCLKQNDVEKAESILNILEEIN